MNPNLLGGVCLILVIIAAVLMYFAQYIGAGIILAINMGVLIWAARRNK